MPQTSRPDKPKPKVAAVIFVSAPKSGPATDPHRLQVGMKRPHPSHIPDYMPVFPDPHTYIRTQVRTHCILLNSKNVLDLDSW